MYCILAHNENHVTNFMRVSKCQCFVYFMWCIYSHRCAHNVCVSHPQYVQNVYVYDENIGTPVSIFVPKQIPNVFWTYSFHFAFFSCCFSFLLHCDTMCDFFFYRWILIMHDKCVEVKEKPLWRCHCWFTLRSARLVPFYK